MCGYYSSQIKDTKTNKPPWPESASELYRPSDRRLSVKLVPTFSDRGVLRTQRGGSPTAVISISRLELLPSSSSIVLRRLIEPRSRPTTSQKIW
jgi:hypothetical protein